MTAGLVSRGALRGPSHRPLFTDIYAATGARPFDHRLWCEAAMVLLPRGCAIGGLSAAWLQGRAEAVIALDAMLHRRLITKQRLWRLIEKRGRMRGLPHLKIALAPADGRAESPMETRVRVLLHDAGLPAPTLQHKIYHRGRFVARVDVAYPEQRMVIEYEGDHHRERSAFRFDLARVDDLIAAGWHVIRVTADDIHLTPHQPAGRVRAAQAVRTG